MFSEKKLSIDRERKHLFWCYFIPFAVILTLAFSFFVFYFKDVVYQTLIIIDYIISILIAFHILRRDVKEYFDFPGMLLAHYKVSIDSTTNPYVLIYPTIWFLTVASILVIVFLVLNVFLTGFSWNNEHIGIKFAKFIISQFVMVGIVYFFARITVQILILHYKKTIEALLNLAASRE